MREPDDVRQADGDRAELLRRRNLTLLQLQEFGWEDCYKTLKGNGTKSIKRCRCPCLVYHGLGEKRCEEHLGPLLLLLVRGHALVVDLRVPVGSNSFHNGSPIREVLMDPAFGSDLQSRIHEPPSIRLLSYYPPPLSV